MNTTQRSVRYIVVMTVVALAISSVGASLLAIRVVYGYPTFVGLFSPANAPYITEDAIQLYAKAAGSLSAKERYLDVARTYKITAQHQIAHAIGHMLYEREGLKAIALCGTDFNYGCLHEVIGQALVNSNFDKSMAIQKLVASCEKEAGAPFGPCAHGIGHGLEYFSAFDAGTIQENLATCDKMHAEESDISATQSCYTGVFMEFNEHFMDESPPRSYASSTPLFPCDMLRAPLHHSMCIFWLVPWMHEMLFNSSYARQPFEFLGNFCRTTVPKELHDQCIMSIGRLVGVNANLPAARAETLCRTATKSQSELELCLTRAAYSYRGEKNISGADALCAMTKDPASCTKFRGTFDRSGHPH